MPHRRDAVDAAARESLSAQGHRASRAVTESPRGRREADTESSRSCQAVLRRTNRLDAAQVADGPVFGAVRRDALGRRLHGGLAVAPLVPALRRRVVVEAAWVQRKVAGQDPGDDARAEHVRPRRCVRRRPLIDEASRRWRRVDGVASTRRRGARASRRSHSAASPPPDETQHARRLRPDDPRDARDAGFGHGPVRPQ